MAPPSTGDKSLASTKPASGHRGRRPGSRYRRSKRSDVDKTGKSTANLSQNVHNIPSTAESSSTDLNRGINASGKTDVPSYADAIANVTATSVTYKEKISQGAKAVDKLDLPTTVPRNPTAENSPSVSFANIKETLIAGQNTHDAEKKISSNENTAHPTCYGQIDAPSNNTSPSTDGTVASGFTDEIVGDYLAKITTIKGRPQTFYYTKNSRYPHASLVLFNLPWSVTYDLVLDIVKHYGDISKFFWSPVDPRTCEVRYLSSTAAECALNLLDRSVVFEGHPPIRAKLKATNPKLQLLITNVANVSNEDDLEKHLQGIVGSRVYAILKRNPDNNHSEGYGTLSFASFDATKKALEKGDGNIIGGKSIRVSQLTPKPAYFHVNNMAPQSTVHAMTNLFSKFQDFAVSDIMTTERCYSFVKFEERESAENAKRELNKSYLDGIITVRYAEAEQTRTTIQVQFMNCDDQDVESVKTAVESEFSKYGTCFVEIDKWADGKWRRLAVVSYYGENAAAAASKAMENVTKVGTFNVWCQFARCLVARVPPTLRPSIELPIAPDYSMFQQSLTTASDPIEAVEFDQTQTAQGLERGLQAHLMNSVPPGSSLQFQFVPGYMPGMAVQEQIDVAVPAAEMPQYYIPPPMPMYWTHMPCAPGYIPNAPPAAAHPFYMPNPAASAPHGMVPLTYSPGHFVPMQMMREHGNPTTQTHAPVGPENVPPAHVKSNGSTNANNTQKPASAL